MCKVDRKPEQREKTASLRVEQDVFGRVQKLADQFVPQKHFLLLLKTPYPFASLRLLKSVAICHLVRVTYPRV